MKKQRRVHGVLNWDPAREFLAGKWLQKRFCVCCEIEAMTDKLGVLCLDI